MQSRKNFPNHIAFTIGGHTQYCQNQGKPEEQKYIFLMQKVIDLISLQVELDIPIMTVYALTSQVKDSDDFSLIMDAAGELFSKLRTFDTIFENKIKISVLGKWYDLPNRVVEPIKRIIDETRDYDSFFFNICINYDGQEEIVDACKIIARKIQAGKMDPDSIDKENIKDNIYSSYFLPPDIIIKTGKDRALHGFLLWDSTQSHLHFSNKLWPELEKKDIMNAIKEWQKTENA